MSRKTFLPGWARPFSVIAVAGLALLLSLPWETLDTDFHWDKTPVEGAGELETPTFVRKVVHIDSHGTTLEAWLYLPKDSSSSSSSSGSSGGPPPVLVMAHGMGAQKDIGLWTYAARFAQAGLAVVVFDYRTFGGSEGTPRHWVSPKRHLEDWAAVVQHIKASNLGGAVDGSRIALWGVSFYAGGHVLVTAAQLGSDISAVVANEPYVSPAAVLGTASVRGFGRSLRLLAVGVADELRRLISSATGLSLPPIYLRLVAPISDPNALALLPLQESEMSLRSVATPPRRQGGWQNKVLGRVVVEALGYNPSSHLGRLTAPVWFRVALLDHLCPPSVVRAALQRSGLPESQYVLQERNVTHLEAHSTGVKEEEIRPVIAFLRRHLGLGEGDGAEGGDGGQPALSLDAAEQLAESQFPDTS